MTTSAAPDIVCIGAVLWDMVGRVEVSAPRGADLPGTVTRLAGGVAFNIAATLRTLGRRPTLLCAVGDDAAGDELVAECERRGIDMSCAYRSLHNSTDRYLAIEDQTGLVAAIADTHTLDQAGAHILAALTDGRLGGPANPWRGPIALDGNLSAVQLAEIAVSPFFAAADLRITAASTGKVLRLQPFLRHRSATLYLNREEAGGFCGTSFAHAGAAADALVARGIPRTVVTDGANECADAKRGEPTLMLRPATVRVNRVTGAGDTFMATHLAAEAAGQTRNEALTCALAAATRYVTGEIGS